MTPDSLCTFLRLTELFACHIANHFKSLAVSIVNLVPRRKLACVVVGDSVDAPTDCFPSRTFYSPPAITWRAIVSAVHGDARLLDGFDAGNLID